ncbi:MAG: HAD hydrolase-like protein, partial [Pseudomonadota bacterium]|nr:HAD hydrolase-like protein [Pseudomonadota bacterium]
MNKFDLLVFDWDGTLSDSVAHIVVSLQNACADMSIAIPSESQARQVIGLGLTEAIELIAPVLRPQDHAL